MTQPQQQQPLSTGQLAAQLNVPVWAVRRAVDAVLPDAPRIGQNRMIAADDVPRVAYVLGVVLPKRED